MQALLLGVKTNRTEGMEILYNNFRLLEREGEQPIRTRQNIEKMVKLFGPKMGFMALITAIKKYRRIKKLLQIEIGKYMST